MKVRNTHFHPETLQETSTITKPIMQRAVVCNSDNAVPWQQHCLCIITFCRSKNGNNFENFPVSNPHENSLILERYR